MTMRFWTGQTGNPNFFIDQNWSPSGTPQAGDLLFDNAGGSEVSDYTADLNGLTIYIGSTYTPADFTVIDHNILSNTVVAFAEPSKPTTTGLLANLNLDNVTNYGAIGSAVDISGSAWYPYLDVNVTGRLTNYGALDTAPAIQIDTSSGGVLENDGQINVEGGLTLINIPVVGNGNININAATLGVNGQPSFLDLDQATTIGAGQNVYFNGGYMLLTAPTQTTGTIRNFATNPENAISILNFKETSDSFSNGVLSINGPDLTDGSSHDLLFSMPDIAASNAHFLIASKDGYVNIEWNASAPVLGPAIPVHVLPPPHSTPTPPGYHLS
jgi:hypothetical protein